jgi:peptide/nickel transport system permease protein
LHSLLLIVGVTLVSFVLMVQFGPDQTYSLLGKNPTAAQIQELRQQLGYDRPFASPGEYLGGLLTCSSARQSQRRGSHRHLGRTLPVTLAWSCRDIINLFAVVLALLTAAPEQPA